MIAIGVSVAIVSVLAASAAFAEEPPRYKFEVGQEIGYRSDSASKFGSGEKAGTFLNTIDYTVWVVRKNENDTWRLVIRQVTESKRLDHEGKERVDSRAPQYAYCDIAADGTFVHNETLQFLNVSWLFPRLPPAADHRIWGARYDWDQTELRYRRDENQPEGNLRFREFRRTMLDPVYGFKWDTVYDFGHKEGLLVTAEQKFEQSVGFVGEGTETWALMHVKQHEPTWARQLADDSQRFFSVRQGDRGIVNAIARQPSQARELVAEAKSAMEVLLETCKSAEVQAMCTRHLDYLKSSEEYYFDQAANLAKLLDQPAPPWETTDWDGKKHSLADYRGKVVLLEFWYRGCGWCIRAMPQIKQLQAEFKDQPVAILGMCEDDEEENARFVVDYLNIEYPTLKSDGIQQKYGDGGWPTLVLIDQQGTVRRIHIGYSPTLRDELGAETRALLAKSKD
ncbi:MAG: TlpA disulfide reductase family protein [Pirellulales bacterium]